MALARSVTLPVGVESGVTGDDGCTRLMGSPGSRDDGAESIQCSLDGGGIPAFLVGLVDQGLHPGDEFVGTCQTAALALVDSLLHAPRLSPGGYYPASASGRVHPGPAADAPVMENAASPIARTRAARSGFLEEVL